MFVLLRDEGSSALLRRTGSVLLHLAHSSGQQRQQAGVARGADGFRRLTDARMDDEQLAARNVECGYECAGLLRIDGRNRVETDPIKKDTRPRAASADANACSPEIEPEVISASATRTISS